MMYTIRDVSEKTKMIISRYAKEHEITIAEALGQLTEYGLEYYEKNRKNPNKYATMKDAMVNLPDW